MFVYLWIISLSVCLIVTLFPINNNASFKTTSLSTHISQFIELSIIACTFILLVSNRFHSDMTNYQHRYLVALSQDSFRELLYFYLRILSYNLGLNFFQFRNIMVFLCGSCAVYSIKKAGVKVSSVLLFYLPVIMFMDSIQFRNAICLYILLLAIHLLKEKTKKNIILYTIVILLISQIHSAFLFYLILLLLYIDSQKRKKILGMIIGFSLALGMITFLNGNRVPFINQIFDLFLSESDERIARYSTSAKFGFLFPTMIHCFTLSFLLFFKKRVILNNKDESFVNVVIGLIECSFVVIPLIMMHMTYYRLLRNAYVISIIAFMILFREIKSNSVYKTLIFGGLIFISVLWGIFELQIYDTIENILYPILNDGVWFLDEKTRVF